MGKKVICCLVVCVCGLIFCSRKKNENPQPQPDPPIVQPDTTKTDTVPQVKYGSLQVNYAHRAGTDTFLINKDYVNSSNETFRVSKLQYILSNFKLKKKDGSVLVLPNTYFLVDPKKSSIALNNIPEGTYIGMSYLIGVDSLTTAGGAQAGALDPVNDMYWSWQTGYIHFTMTGISPSSIISTKVFVHDIGGFIAPNQTQQVVSHSFGQDSLLIKKDFRQLITIDVDILEYFKNPVDISIASVSSIMGPGKNSVTSANNYKDMFTFQNIRR